MGLLRVFIVFGFSVETGSFRDFDRVLIVRDFVDFGLGRFQLIGNDSHCLCTLFG